jgi:hypothetical protein
MAIIEAYYAVAAGSDLASLVNIETLLGKPPFSLPDRRIPLLASNGRRTLNQALQRNGSINVKLPVSFVTQTNHNAFVYSVFGGFTVASKAVVLSAIDETGYYSPFTAELDRPIEAENYQVSPGGVWLIEYELPFNNLTLQSTTVTGDTTITSSTRLVYANTAGGNIIITLPAVGTPGTYTPFGVVKTSASNTVTIKDAAAATVTTITALYGRKDLITNGTAWVIL